MMILTELKIYRQKILQYSDREIQEMIHIPRRTFECNIVSALKQLNVHIDDYL